MEELIETQLDPGAENVTWVLCVCVFQGASPQGRCYKCQQLEAYMLSHVRHSATSWTIACRAPLSMGVPGKNTGVGCHFLLQGIF